MTNERSHAPNRVAANGSAPYPAGRGLRRPERFFEPGAYRKYDAEQDGLLRVGRVVPAFRQGDRVSVDGISDHQHSLVEVTTRDGRVGHVLVCRDGWTPLSWLDPYEEGGGEGVNPRGWRVTFKYSTHASTPMRGLCLSAADQRKIVAAMLAAFMSPRAGR